MVQLSSSNTDDGVLHYLPSGCSYHRSDPIGSARAHDEKRKGVRTEEKITVVRSKSILDADPISLVVRLKAETKSIDLYVYVSKIIRISPCARGAEGEVGSFSLSSAFLVLLAIYRSIISLCLFAFVTLRTSASIRIEIISMAYGSLIDNYLPNLADDRPL